MDDTNTFLQRRRSPADGGTDSTAVETGQYRLLAMVDIDGMADINRELGLAARQRGDCRRETLAAHSHTRWRRLARLARRQVPGQPARQRCHHAVAGRPAGALRCERTKTSLTVCAIALNSPTTTRHRVAGAVHGKGHAHATRPSLRARHPHRAVVALPHFGCCLRAKGFRGEGTRARHSCGPLLY